MGNSYVIHLVIHEITELGYLISAENVFLEDLNMVTQ